MTKKILVGFEDDQFEALKTAKAGLSWRDFILKLLPQKSPELTGTSKPQAVMEIALTLNFKKT
ncbi:MAG: hypothetical protein WED05_11480 [Candidatus Atabeyarchaeum deiterrae]